ncbi:hypothetical protein J2T56_001840 [Natronobacillus azotifigens]|uniref:Nuclease-related domain-containing protein n=1 Tax=Natronobacillus azotifigens TaxID=472978 RepID=A0A9J6RDE0_9BACI|nr:nuclease-related domain-containing protein [Natronobacillus azotifigens]MCZ0703696.1 nuclease-related domain-containing protein [Natronobacillus azotifigens]
MYLSKPLRTFEYAQLGAILPRLNKKYPHYLTLSEIYDSVRSAHLQRRYLHQHLTGNLVMQPVFYGLTFHHVNQIISFDALIVTPSVLYLLETKYVSKSVILHHGGKLIELDSRSILDPSDCSKIASDKEKFLSSFLHHHGFPSIPIHSLTVFTNPKAILYQNKSQPDVIPTNQLFYRLASLSEAYPRSVYSPRQIRQLNQFFVKMHYVDRSHIIQVYSIPDEAIRKGVWCTGCRHEMMYRAHGYWQCDCGTRSRDAHVPALRDFALLYRTTITNREARCFLQVESPPVVTRLFAETKLERTGNTHSLVYRLDKLFDN